MPEPLFRNVDCLGVQVPDVGVALEFYQQKLGHRLLWRTPTSAGLALADAEIPELVLHTDVWPIATALKVDSVQAAVERFVACGGSVVEPPSEIPIGWLAVLADPWGNHLVVLDATKGRFQTDREGKVVGVGPGPGQV